MIDGRRGSRGYAYSNFKPTTDLCDFEGFSFFGSQLLESIKTGKPGIQSETK